MPSHPLSSVRGGCLKLWEGVLCPFVLVVSLRLFCTDLPGVWCKSGVDCDLIWGAVRAILLTAENGQLSCTVNKYWQLLKVNWKIVHRLVPHESGVWG